MAAVGHQRRPAVAGGFSTTGPARGGRLGGTLGWVLAIMLALGLAASIFVLPTPLALLPVAAVAAVVGAFGFEALIALAWLGAMGLLPFIDVGGTVAGRLPTWLLLWALGCALMLAIWGARVMAKRPARPLEPNLLLVLIAVYLVYAFIRVGASEPLSLPSLAGPTLAPPVAAVITYLWLSHDEALAGLRRTLPLIMPLLAAWGAFYIAGAAGCDVCRAYVDTGDVRTGLLGPDTRLYTGGQNSFLGLSLIAFALMLRRFNPLTAGLTAIAVLSIAVQYSRAQYFAFLAGALLLLVWRFGRSSLAGRILLVATTFAGALALLATPAGERALSGVSDITSQGGNVGFRLMVLDAAMENWSLFGYGVYRTILGEGLNYDLGFPNTLLVLGYVGGALQIGMLVVALVRSLSAGTLAGATLAAIFLMVLVARPTLPLLEYGHSGVAYGAALGFAAALQVRRARAHAPA